MTFAELKRQAQAERDKIALIVANAEKDNREVTAEEASDIEAFRKSAEAYDRRAKYADEVETNRAAAETNATQSAGRKAPHIAAPVADNGVECRSIEAVPGGSQEDKTYSMGEFLGLLAELADPQNDGVLRQRNHELLTNKYKSRYRRWDRSNNPETRTLSSTIGASGGWAMPTGFHNEIMKEVSELAIVRPRATKIPMGAMSIPIPLLDQYSTPPTDGSSFFGGINLGWTGEAQSKPDQNPAFAQDTLEAKELSGTMKVPNLLLKLSPFSLDPLFRTLFAEAVAWIEDYAFFRGDRPTRPKGIFSSPALVTTSARGSASAITLANAVDVFTRVSISSRSRAVFVASQAAEPAVLKMTGSNNTVMIPAGFIPSTAAEGANSVFNYGILNRPVLVSEKLPALNTAGDFGCFDFSRYLVGDVGLATEIAVSQERYFEENVTAYRVLHYVAGMPWPKKYVTLADGTTTVSPFVVLGIQ